MVRVKIRPAKNRSNENNMTGENVSYSISLKDYFSKVISDAENKAKQFEGTIGDIDKSLIDIAKSAGIAFGVYEAINFGNEILDITTKLETLNNVINYTSVDTADAAKNHQFLNRIIDDMKLPLIETTEGFSKLNATMMGSKLAGEETRKIFEGVSIASTAMHLSAEDQKLVFLALSQMMSKGTVSAEELRGQLAERLPGALKLAADAMGVTQAQFQAMMKDGDVVSSEFLPKFAAKLKETFEGAIPNAVKSLQALRTENENTWLKLKADIGEASIPIIHNILSISSGTADLMRDIAKFKGVILVVVGSMAAYWLATTGLTTALGALMAAQTALNSIMLLNPYGVALVAIGLLVAAVWDLTKANAALYAQYEHNLDNSIIKAKEDEIKVVNELADSYIKNGMAAKRAREMVLADEKEILRAQIERINATRDKTGLAAARARLSVLSRTDLFDKKNNVAEIVKKSKDSDTAKVKGTSHTTVNMTINKLVETIMLTTNNFTESKAKIKEEVAKALMEAAMDAQILSRG